MMKRFFQFLPLLVLALAACNKIELPGRDDGSSAADRKELVLADANATPETKALYANVWKIKDKGFMFGHHDDLMYGRYWYGDEGGSDTKAVCGDYPAVYSLDFAEMIDDRWNDSPSENALRKKCVKEAYDKGMVIIACVHLDNPKTVMAHRAAKTYDANKNGGAWDNSDKEVVAQILRTGSATNLLYTEWMDRLAELAHSLKGSDGKLIPIIFRPYHEHTQSWSWWGSSCTTEQEFIKFWQWTVTYLRDAKGVHNFIYAISPQMDSQKQDSDFLFRWPGDKWVDFIGMDCYQGINNAVFTANLKAISRVALSKGKPCGVTETGVESFTKATYWTENIYAPASGRKISLLVTWRNKFVGANENDKHYFSVYPGHPSAKDFVTMYSKDDTFFCRDLPDMYYMPSGYVVK